MTHNVAGDRPGYVKYDKKALVNTVFAFLSLLMGYLFVRNTFFTAIGVGMTAFVLLFVAASAVFMRLHGVRFTPRNISGPAIMLVFSAAFVVSGSESMRELTLLFECLAAVYWYYSAFGCREEGKIGDMLPFDMIKSVFVMPFSSFFAQPRFTASVLGRTRFGRVVLYVLLGFACAVIPAVIIVTLLISADDVFANLINLIFDSFLSGVASNLLYLTLGFPAAMYIFGMMLSASSNKNSELMTRGKCARFSTAIGFMPPLAVYSALTVILLIYALFFVSQSSYFLSAFASLKPDGYSYADYARKGFFELCRVSVINGVLIVLSSLFIRRTPKPEKSGQAPTYERYDVPSRTEGVALGAPDGMTGIDAFQMDGDTEPAVQPAPLPKLTAPVKPLVGLRVYSVLMGVFTLVLIATAASKLYMYIDCYGLTLKRVNAAWFELLLAAAFVFLIIRQLAPRFNFWRASASAFVILLGLLVFSNADVLIARYNVERFYEGTLSSVDVELFYSLSDAALPELTGLLKRDEASGFTLLDTDTRSRAERCIEYKLEGARSACDRTDTVTEKINHALGYNYSRMVEIEN